MNATVTALPNSTAEIQKRVAAGKITWAGTLIMVSSRAVFGLISQPLVAAIFFRGSADPRMEAAAWWKVYATLGDLGCIALLVWLTRREGIRLFDLGNYRRKGWLRDVLIGVGLFVPYLLLGAVVPVAFMTLLGFTPPEPTPLPTWVTLYGIIIWPIIWAPTEDNTYIGYSLPRLEALTGRKWLAVVVMGFFAALQHAFWPSPVLDWRPLVGWFVGLVPMFIFYGWVYWRLGRLLPIHVGHWLTDIVAFFVVFFFS